MFMSGCHSLPLFIILLILSDFIVASPTVIERNIARHFGETVASEKPQSELMKRIEVFAEKTMASDDVDTRIKGRKLGHALAVLQDNADAELCLLELLWRAKNAGMHVNPSDIAETAVPAATVAQSAKWTGKTQRPPISEMSKWKSIDVRDFRTDIGDGWQIMYYNSLFIRLYYWGGSTNNFTGGLPGGTMRLKYFIPDSNRESWLEYELIEDVNPRPSPECMAALDGYAPDPCYWLYEHERRDPVANPLPCTGKRKLTASRRYGRECPYPYSTRGGMSSYPFTDRGDRWIYEFTIHPGDYLLQLPCTRSGFSDTWYIEAEYKDSKNVSHSARVKLLWPIGTAESDLKMRDRLPFDVYTTVFPNIYSQLREKWDWSDEPRFYNDFVKPLLDADVKLLERTSAPFGARPKILNECDADRLKFYHELPRMVFVSERIDELRKDYLRALLDDREPSVPKVHNVPNTQHVESDEIRLDEPVADGLMLDEEEI